MSKIIIPVLDKGSVELMDHMGGDLSIVRNARQSYNADWRAGEDKDSDDKLIRFLLRMRHTGPFEHTSINIGIKAPIFVIRQWHRHRTQSYSEVSLRYVELNSEEFFIPSMGRIGLQSTTNKQASEFPEEIDEVLMASIQGTMHNVAAHCFYHYKELIKQGVPRERARTVLPLSTYTRFSATDRKSVV